MRTYEILRALTYTMEFYEIHAWKLSIHDSQNLYYLDDYENADEFEADILQHLMQYGIESLYLISHGLDNDTLYKFQSFYDVATSDFDEYYYRLRRIN